MNRMAKLILFLVGYTALGFFLFEAVRSLAVTAWEAALIDTGFMILGILWAGHD